MSGFSDQITNSIQKALRYFSGGEEEEDKETGAKRVGEGERRDDDGDKAVEKLEGPVKEDGPGETDGRGEDAGSTRDKSNVSGKKARKISVSNFLIGDLIGEGAYARVHICEFKKTKERFAMKIMEKHFILAEKKKDLVQMERNILMRVNHPNIVSLAFSFHDEKNLYIVMDLCRGGELSRLIRHYLDRNQDQGKEGRALSVGDARFYFKELVSAVQYLHAMGIVHRDLKPENVLLTEEGHVKLTDFGTAKDETGPPEKVNPFVGSTDYVSPEVLKDIPASTGADLWALGCILYAMLVGIPPFRAESDYLVFENIIHHNQDSRITIPELDGHIDEEDFGDAEDLINKLLVPDPVQRLGAANNSTPARKDVYDDSTNPPSALSNHVFFQPVSDVPPRLPYEIKYLDPMVDGASADWAMQGDITEFEMQSRSARSLDLTVTSYGSTSEGIEQFLESNESIILDGIVKKQSNFRTLIRHLVLTDKPRLFYVDPQKMVFKGEIAITEDLVIEVKPNKKFEITNSKKTYYFTDLLGDPERWLLAIEAEKHRLFAK